MKTSTKLLIGLFVVIIIAIITVNFVFKKKLDTKSKTKIEITQPATINSETSDSLAMDSAINNE